MEMFEVGGCVRDEILGLRSKDIDFTVVLDPSDIVKGQSFDPYNSMVSRLEFMGVRIIRDDNGVPIGADFLTVRGIAPKDFPKYPGRALDFVLARKERDYDGRRPGHVEPGTLEDDLARRDFTMNAIAKDKDGNFIDPFNGREDIANRVIRAVGDPAERFAEDALRVVRALRFKVTKGFEIEASTKYAMQLMSVLDDIASSRISDERIREELSRMFAFDTVASLLALGEFPALTAAMFSGSVRLDATMKQAKGK